MLHVYGVHELMWHFNKPIVSQIFIQTQANCCFQVIARVVDGSQFDEFKALFGETLVTGESTSDIFVYWRHIVLVPSITGKQGTSKQEVQGPWRSA